MKRRWKILYSYPRQLCTHSREGEIIWGAWIVMGSQWWPGIRKSYTEPDHEHLPFPAICMLESHGPIGNPVFPVCAQFHHWLLSAAHTEGTFVDGWEDNLSNVIIKYMRGMCFSETLEQRGRDLRLTQWLVPKSILETRIRFNHRIRLF